MTEQENVSQEQPEADINQTKTESAPVSISGGGGIFLKPLHMLIAGVLVIGLTMGGVFFGMWINGGDDPMRIDPNAKDYTDLYFGEAAEEGNITAPGYADITFPANTRSVQMILPNPSQNPCYFRYTLILTETNETIYSSGLIAPGKAVTDLTLSRPLDTGSYHVKILIDTFSIEDRSSMNGIEMEVRLTVK